MEEVIKPCPFCDYDDPEVDEIEIGVIAVCCPECNAIGPRNKAAQSLRDAIAKWNCE